MYCPKCGTASADGDLFCQSCGASLTSRGPSQAPSQDTRSSGPTQFGQTSGTGQARVHNHLAWAIISLIFFFLPTGIVAVVYSVKVDNLLAVGDVRGAEHASGIAKTWCIVSTVVFCFGLVLGLVVGLLGLGVGLSLGL